MHTLKRLGCDVAAEGEQDLVVGPPSFRRDLQREIDLVEEVGRLHGYDHLPEVPRTPVTVVPRSAAHRVTDRVRDVLVACCGTLLAEALAAADALAGEIGLCGDGSGERVSGQHGRSSVRSLTGAPGRRSSGASS